MPIPEPFYAVRMGQPRNGHTAISGRRLAAIFFLFEHPTPYTSDEE
jgi:hypothetical protein